MNLRLMSFLALLCLYICPEPAQAHGSVTPEEDICIIRIGYYKAHFKIYLPQTDGHDEYCEDVPGTGETVFIMEYEHSGLGDVPVDFRVIRNVTGKGIFTALQDVESIGDLEPVTVVHHAAAVQPDVFTIMYDFREEGEFVGIVTVQNQETGKVYTAVFPFEVGFAGFGWWPWFVAILVAIQFNYLLMSGWFARWRNGRQTKPAISAETEHA